MFLFGKHVLIRIRIKAPIEHKTSTVIKIEIGNKCFSTLSKACSDLRSQASSLSKECDYKVKERKV